MHIIKEEQVSHYLSYSDAIDVVRGVFANLSDGEVENFPFLRESLGEGRWFGIKSGCDHAQGQLGLKAGGFWNGNPDVSLDRHQSTVLLFDLATGQVRAVIGGNYLTGIRTAAASALSSELLAREDSSRLAVIGVGTQAIFQLKATMLVRPIREVVAWGPTPERVAAFGKAVEEHGLKFEQAASAAEAVQEADIAITITPSTAPLLRLADLPEGIHIAAMGSDAPGKQELASDILGAANLVVDDVDQARAIGECQYLEKEPVEGLATIGDIVRGVKQGRRTDAEVTVFDGTGLGLQDIAASTFILNQMAVENSHKPVAI